MHHHGICCEKERRQCKLRGNTPFGFRNKTTRRLFCYSTTCLVLQKNYKWPFQRIQIKAELNDIMEGNGRRLGARQGVELGVGGAVVGLAWGSKQRCDGGVRSQGSDQPPPPVTRKGKGVEKYGHGKQKNCTFETQSIVMYSILKYLLCPLFSLGLDQPPPPDAWKGKAIKLWAR